jgi:transcriptional regulator with XRE-family HTH domain
VLLGGLFGYNGLNISRKTLAKLADRVRHESHRGLYDGSMSPREEAPENLVGELIRRQRELAELSMRQVAAMAGISNPYLSQIEHGLRAPSADVLEGIAATLGVSVDSLRARTSADDHAFDGDGDHEAEQQEPGEHATIVAAISADPGLTARQRRALIEIYTAMTEATASRRYRRSS